MACWKPCLTHSHTFFIVESVYLPIDSKFPTSSYTKILEAIENGDINVSLTYDAVGEELTINVTREGDE